MWPIPPDKTGESLSLSEPLVATVGLAPGWISAFTTQCAYQIRAGIVSSDSQSSGYRSGKGRDLLLRATRLMAANLEWEAGTSDSTPRPVSLLSSWPIPLPPYVIELRPSQAWQNYQVPSDANLQDTHEQP